MAEFDNIYMHGFVRAAAASPRVHLADPASNARETIELMRKADKAGAALVIFPELGLSGYTIDDLHLQSTLLSAVLDAIARVKDASKSLAPVVVVGAPIQVGPSEVSVRPKTSRFSTASRAAVRSAYMLTKESRWERFWW